jgi:hypothetical protein
MFKDFRDSLPVILLAMATLAHAAQLSTNALAAIPHNVEQLVVIDSRALQNSTVAMELRDRVTPPELKKFEDALTNSGLNDNHDVDQLVFAAFHPEGSEDQALTVGIAQGQFTPQTIQANFRKQKIKPTIVRTYQLYPMAKTDMVVCFVDSSTMVFGGPGAVKKALDARDGAAANLLTNTPMTDAMKTVDFEPFWSILDEKGTQATMRQMLGDAGSVTNFESVRERLLSSSYSMNFQHGVKFDFTLSTGDSFAAATLSTLINTAVEVRKLSCSEAEKQALSATSINSDTGRLSIHFATSDSEFSSLLQSPLFQSIVH